jgi:hypothetical protein
MVNYPFRIFIGHLEVEKQCSSSSTRDLISITCLHTDFIIYPYFALIEAELSYRIINLFKIIYALDKIN